MAIRMTGLVSGMDTESMVKELVAAQKSKNQRVVNKQTKLTWTQDKWKELNAKLYSFYTQSASKMRMEGNYKTKTASSSDETKAVVTATAGASEGAHTLQVTKLASAQYTTGGKVTATSGNALASDSKLSSLLAFPSAAVTLTVDGQGTVDPTFTIDGNTTIAEFVQKCKDANLNATFDSVQQRFFVGSKTSGAKQAFTISASGADGASALASLGLTAAKGMTVVAADDAEIILDGATLTGETNTISANNLTIALKDKTTQTVSVNVANNTQGTYDMVKEFVTKYNELLKEINTMYYAGNARGYEPLTDEEKEKMPEETVEKWETKIKDSLLRRDSTLGTLITSLNESMKGSVTVGDKSYSLSSFGIRTSSDYTEKGLLHIYGEKTDSTYATESNKLMTALEKDPETVMKVLSGLGKDLYDTMTKEMSSIPNIRSAYSFYNDKQMATQQTAYTKEIATLESRLTDMESRYYKQFSAMETALQKLQSQTNSLTSLLGTG